MNLGKVIHHLRVKTGRCENSGNLEGRRSVEHYNNKTITVRSSSTWMHILWIRLVSFHQFFYWKTLGSVLSHEDDALVTLAPSNFESSHLLFHFFLCPRILNKIIIVCSMKFLPHFPLLMIILFKVYQLENVLRNLNANDSNKCVWGKTQYCVLLLLFLSLEMPSCFLFKDSALYERHN